jgi:hypothetical protein
MAESTLRPVTGTYTVKKTGRDIGIRPSEAFDAAWQNALDRAARAWGEPGKPVQVKVRVEYGARIDITNPGGVGVCTVTLIPTG